MVSRLLAMHITPTWSRDSIGDIPDTTAISSLQSDLSSNLYNVKYTSLLYLVYIIIVVDLQ